MADINTTAKFTADISSLKTAMQQAQRQVKLVTSEFRAATAGMDDWTKSEEGLAAKLKQLNGILDAQKKKLAVLNAELKNAEQTDGKGSAAADRLRTSINNLQASITKTEKDIAQYNKQLEELPETMEDAGDAADKASEGFTVFKGALAGLVADGAKVAISALKDLAKEAFNVGKEYESSMSNVKAKSGATADEMNALKEVSLELASQSKFTASEVADGFSYMAMAGWKANEMLDGIEGVMNLAAASGADLATTSDIVTDALTAMKYQAKDAGRLADVMASASSNANTNVEMMGSTFQYVAPLIGALGMSMEDTAVAIGLMANAGIKGDKAGTALRSTLNRLSAPPKECATEMEKLGLSLTDSDGKMKSLQQVIIELRGAFKGLSETEKTAAAKHIAGAEAMSGLLAIVNASDQDFQKLTYAINNSSGAAEEMAKTMNDNVGGQLTLLRSKIEGIMIKLFKRASDSMKQGIETVGEALDKVDWDKAGDNLGKFATSAANLFKYLITNSSTIINVLKVIGTAFATIFVAQKISATVSEVKTLVTVIKSASSASELLTSAMGALGISMSALPVLAVAAAFATLVTAYKVGSQQIEANAKATYGLSSAQEKLIDSIHQSSQAITDSAKAMKEEGESIDSNYQSFSNMVKSYNDLIDENGKVKSGSEELAQTLLGSLAEGLGTTVEKIKENIDQNGKLSDSIDKLIEKKKQEALIAAYEDDYNKALKDEYDNWKKLTSTKNDYTKATKELNDAQAEYDRIMENANYFETNGFKAAETMRQIEQSAANLEAAKQKVADLGTAVAEQSQNWSHSQSVIENYNTAVSAAATENTEEVSDALNKLKNNLVNYGTASREQLEQQVIDTKKNLDEVRQAYSQGVVDESFVSGAQQSFDLAKQELDKFATDAGTAGTDASNNLKGSISDGLAGLAGTVEDIGSSSYGALKASMGDWKAVGDEKTGDFLGVLDGKTGEASQKGEALAKSAADGAKNGSKEFKAASEDNVKNGYIGSMESLNGEVKNQGSKLPEWAGTGAQSNEAPLINAGNWTTVKFGDAIAQKQSYAEGKAKEVATATATALDSNKGEAEKSGQNFAQGFINGIGSLVSAAVQKAKELADAALGSLKSTQKEGSPSKITYESGEFFGEGYEKGIESTKKAVLKAAGGIAKLALSELKKTQKEGSPSQLTYQSGRMFTQGYINGIGSLEKQLVQTTKNLVNKALAELLKLKDFNFSDVAENASTAFSSGVQKQISYMLDRISYQNQQQLKDFDNTMQQLQDASAAEVEKAQADSQKKQDKLQKKIEKKQEKTQTKSVKKQIKNLQKKVKAEQKALTESTEQISKSYEQQIAEQQKMKEAYQQASASMISQFQEAVQEYQTAAQKLIDDTMNNISSDYQSQYDALISKQDNLIQKLKDAGDLFNVSNAGVMTINDIKAQTQAIRDYASRLEQIKKKVSSDLFDEIAKYDIKEGNAFMDRLLAMSDAELKAYSDAFDEKMSVAESLSKNLYKSDFDTIANNYEKAMKAAFAGLPKQLEQLGYQTMQGFLSGLTTNTAYMEESVKTFISGMVDTFKQQLGIHSPSKVGISLGENFGGAFADGLLEMVKTVQAAAKDITSAVTDSLDFQDSISAAKASVSAATGTAGMNRNAGSFVGDRRQIINFNQINNSPKALDRLTIYRQTNNILFQAKVGLSNV